LREYKWGCISPDELEEKYQEWVRISDRGNTMTEYGSLISILGYINKNSYKGELILIVEKRKHFS
jgi:hypothetical protein